MSSYSAASGNCVEVADLSDGVCAVRDSKNPTGSDLVHCGVVGVHRRGPLR
ncbi:MAG: DUF397 domain-containing protein [Pseudonocardiaceae bacterium]